MTDKQFRFARTSQCYCLGQRENACSKANCTQFKPKNGDGSTVEDTPRNRCLEFIKHLVKWENSNAPEYIEPARKLIAAAHLFLHPGADSETPKVLDPFSGGGAIPLEALRLGCETYSLDINPVAHLIQRCTLEYPQKYGRPGSRPVPQYIKRLVGHNGAKKAKQGPSLFEMDREGDSGIKGDGEIIPAIDITESDYRKNPLAADVLYWGYWVLASARRGIGGLYQSGHNGEMPAAYVWARTVKCPNPLCRRTIPLYRRSILSESRGSRTAFKINESKGKLTVTVLKDDAIDFDTESGTIRAGSITCPYCTHSESDRWLQSQGVQKAIVDTPLAVVCLSKGRKTYRPFNQDELRSLDGVSTHLDRLAKETPGGAPTEPISDKRPSPNSRGLSAVTRYGITRFEELFNQRQRVALLEFCRQVRSISSILRREIADEGYQTAILCYLALSVGRLSDFNSRFCTWSPGGEFLGHTFTRHALGMVWDYAEVNPFSGSTGDWSGSLDWITRVIEHCSSSSALPALVRIGDATRLPFDEKSVQAVLTDPPYYDSVPYADISDFFYVWLRRALGDIGKETFRTPLTPKSSEVVMHAGREGSAEKAKKRYEAMMTQAFSEQSRILTGNGITLVVFAHRTTSAWEALIQGLLAGGLSATASWPLRTERGSRLIAQQTASLASSIIIICRKRLSSAGIGFWDDVRTELQKVGKERLEFFWSQGIRGADFFISAIGPALSVFGKYERVTKLSGEEVTVSQFLDEVRSLVTNYALAKILRTAHTGTIDPESRFYVVWKWSYADAKVPADESFKLAQALGMDTDLLWDKTGVLEKSSENVLATPISKRVKIKNLGEPAADGTPASLIDVLHRMRAFREKGDTQGMAQFLNRSGHANNHSLWLIAQAVSEILLDGDKEKQLMQGLLNQKEGLVEATRQGELF